MEVVMLVAHLVIQVKMEDQVVEKAIKIQVEVQDQEILLQQLPHKVLMVEQQVEVVDLMLQVEAVEQQQ